MIKKYLLGLALGVIFCYNVEAQTNWRPYISTELAKVIVFGDKDDDEDEALCDGSGYITHGDGHKTKCPGCSACKNGEDAIMEYDFYIYHFGAEWCAPCKKLKEQVWEDDEVKKLLEDNKAKLHFYDADTPGDKVMFKEFGVTSYPTVIIVRKDNLSESLGRFRGGASKTTMIKFIKESIKNEQAAN